MMDRARSNLIFAHQEWLGFVQPVGLLLSPIVMVDAQVVPDRNISVRQREFRRTARRGRKRCHGRWFASDIRRVFVDYLGWEEGDLLDASRPSGRAGNWPSRVTGRVSSTWAVPGDEDTTVNGRCSSESRTARPISTNRPTTAQWNATRPRPIRTAVAGDRRSDRAALHA